MSLREIKQIIERMEKQEQDSSAYRSDLKHVEYKISLMSTRISASAPNWIRQELDDIIKFIKESINAK